MKKVLFVSNHAGFSKFNAPYMQFFHENGWQVDNVSPGIETGYYDNQYDLPISRSPFSFSNLKALFLLKNLCKKNNYDLIHCHTPVGGVLGRLCVNIKKSKTKVIYTAHGFHFFKGAKLIDWLVFYPIEKFLAHRSNCIVTINHEDFELASKKFNSKIKKIDGVGVKLDRFVPVTNAEKLRIRNENGFLENDFILIYCAQFIPRKNHIFLIAQIEKLISLIPELKVCLVGNGKDEEKIKKIVSKKNLNKYFKFLGYRKDVEKLYAMSDVLVSTSLQEGFGINLVEGMACGLPLVISDIRGHRDIVQIAKENFLFSFKDDRFCNSLLDLYKNADKRKLISKLNVEYAKNFSVEHSLMQMSQIYREVMEGNK